MRIINKEGAALEPGGGGGELYDTIIRASADGNVSFNGGLRYLQDASGVVAVNWASRQLQDTGGNPMVYWSDPTQVLVGSGVDIEFASSANGIILKDTVGGSRYRVQVTAGALVLTGPL